MINDDLMKVDGVSAQRSTEAEQNPYDAYENNSIDDNQKALRRVDAGVKSFSKTGSVGETLEEDSLRYSVQEQDELEVDSMEQERRTTFQETVEHLATIGRADVLPQAISAAREDYQESLERAKKAITPFFARVYNTPGAEHLTDQQVADLAIRDYTLDSFAEALDEQGGWATAKDILNMIVVPDESYNASVLTDGNWFTSIEGMQRLAARRQALTPFERIQFDNTIKEMIGDIESSKVQQFTTMLQVMGEDPHMGLTHWLDKAAVLDYALIGTKLMTGLKSLNVMRKMSKLDQAASAKVADITASSPEVAKGLGVPQLDAAMAGNPLKAALKDTTLKGTTTSSAAEVETRVDKVGYHLRRVDDVLGAQVGLTEEEAVEAAARWAKTVEGRSGVSEAVVEHAGRDMAIIRYKTRDGSKEFVHEYTLDDFGGFHNKEFSIPKTYSSYLWSPMLKHGGVDRLSLAEAPIYGEFQRARAIAAYQKSARAALQPIKNNKESLTKVNNLLGELNGIDYPTDRHTMMNVGYGGTTLNEKEFEAFAGIRRIFDHMHAMNNQTMREEMRLKGLSSANIGGETYYSRTYNNAEDAKGAYFQDVGNNQIMRWDGTETSTTGRVGAKQIEAEYAKGNVLVKVDGDPYGWFKDSTGNHSKYAIVPKGFVRELPDQVLPYTPNYIPRSRKEANYFIKQDVDMVINGNKVKRERTVAWAHTEAQATKWLDNLEKSTPGFNRSSWKVLGDREVKTAGVADDDTVIRMNGGMYRGSRSSTGLTFAGDDVDGKMVDALDSLQAAMKFTADRMTMSKARSVLKHRWYQDAALVDSTINRLPWSEAMGAIQNSSASPQRKAALLSAHRQISHISSVPVRSEQEFAGALKSVAKHFDKKGKESAARWFYNKSATSNPINALKGGSFHLMLGAYNPAQYLVQLMGATAAVSANPVAFAKAAPRIFTSTMTDLIDEKLLRTQTLKFLSDKKVVPKEVKADVDFWRASGMKESVLRMNADFDNAGNYRPLDAGVVRRGIGGLMDKSTVFYEAGELASMRTSFFTSLEYHKAKAGSSWRYTEENLQKVVARAEQYRLGMSATNKAEFQKGLMALPTQFKSIYTKFLESIFGDWFTPAEKAKIVVGQMALFGAAGVPFFNYWADSITELLAPEDATPEQLRAIRTGSVGWLINGVWDIDAAIAGRVSIAGNLVEEIVDMVHSEQSTYKAFMGASFSTTDKSIDAVKNMLMAGRMLWEDEHFDSSEKLGMAAKIAGYNLAQIPTSTRRWMEAYIYSSFGEVRTTTGRVLHKEMMENVQTRDVVARALGFASEDIQDIYKVNQALYDRNDKIRDVSNFYLNTMNALTLFVDEGDEKQIEAVQMTLSAVLRRIQNDKDREDILNAISAGLRERQFKEQTIQSWLENHTSELLNAKGRLFIVGEEQFREDTGQ